MKKIYFSPDSEELLFRLERSFCNTGYKSNGIQDYNLRDDIELDWDE